MEYQILLIEVMATLARRAGFLLRGVMPFFLLAQRTRPRVLLPPSGAHARRARRVSVWPPNGAKVPVQDWAHREKAEGHLLGVDSAPGMRLPSFSIKAIISLTVTTG